MIPDRVRRMGNPIAVTVPVFSRVGKLESLFRSVETFGIEDVYVADDGEKTDAKEELYSTDWDFSLTVIDLPYDAGVGKKREVLSTRPDEEYLLFLDSDMEVPHNYELLYEQLEERPDSGGVCGMYLEPGRISTVSSDFYEEDGTLYRGVRTRKEIETVAGAPYVEFDFHPQVGLFRRECFEDYTWDDFYTIMREHIDFFLGHWKQTDWTFGLCPEVLIPHYPGGSANYRSHRESEEKFERSDRYFCEKWGYDEMVIENDRWIDTYDAETRSFHLSSDFDRFRIRTREQGAVDGLRFAAEKLLERFLY